MRIAGPHQSIYTGWYFELGRQGRGDRPLFPTLTKNTLSVHVSSSQIQLQACQLKNSGSKTPLIFRATTPLSTRHNGLPVPTPLVLAIAASSVAFQL